MRYETHVLSTEIMWANIYYHFPFVFIRSSFCTN